MIRQTVALLCFLGALGVAAAACAEDAGDTAPHLPLPRFASLRSGEVNMRTGPGTRYPIAWVYTKRGLPVEVTAEYDIWRRVRDPEGIEGWVHKTELTGKRMAVIRGGTHELRDGRSDEAPVLAHVENGAVGQLLSCAPEWCKLKIDGLKGYMRKGEIWGAYPGENFD